MLVKRRADDIAVLKAAIEEAISKWQKSTATLSDIRVLDVLSNKDIAPVHMNRGSKVKSRSPSSKLAARLSSGSRCGL